MGQTMDLADHPTPRPLSPAKVRRSPERFVLGIALTSRLLLLALMAFWRLLFRPYDTSASLNPSCLSANAGDPGASPESVLWPRIGAAIEDSVVWDGVYFVRIAECGYEYEQTYAFLPLLPISIAVFSKSVLGMLVPVIGYRAVLALSGYLINNVAFLFAALFLYRLSHLVLKNSTAAVGASILFCFNPASVFYSSIYSESLYALLSLGGVYYLFSGADNVAMLLLALSGSVRSNGALNAGYFCFKALGQVYEVISQKKSLIFAVKPVLAAVLRSLFIFMPFIAFQAYGYVNICLNNNADEMRPWCKARVPLLYGFLQSHYWGVGFLRYFQLKQLPNFLLASPVLSLAVYSIVHYATTLLEAFRQLNWLNKRVDISTKGKTVETDETTHSNLYSLNQLSHRSHQGKSKFRLRRHDTKDNLSGAVKDSLSEDQQGCETIIFLPFILHLAFMTFTAFFVMHVQVSTRFLAASPLIYWFATTSSSYRRWGYLIWGYCISYILLGSLLFSNFYPFT